MLVPRLTNPRVGGQESSVVSSARLHTDEALPVKDEGEKASEVTKRTKGIETLMSMFLFFRRNRMDKPTTITDFVRNNDISYESF